MLIYNLLKNSFHDLAYIQNIFLQITNYIDIGISSALDLGKIFNLN